MKQHAFWHVMLVDRDAAKCVVVILEGTFGWRWWDGLGREVEMREVH